MIESAKLVRTLHIDRNRLAVFIARGWLAPALRHGRPVFGEVEIARAALIVDLTEEMGVNDDGIDVVLDLLDQIHGLRSRCSRLIAVLAEEGRGARQHAASELHTRPLEGPRSLR